VYFRDIPVKMPDIPEKISGYEGAADNHTDQDGTGDPDFD
jgi:hypothetical protein